MPYESVYPSNRDDLVDKLPFICAAADTLFTNLFASVVARPGADIFARTLSDKCAPGEPVELGIWNRKGTTDARSVGECIMLRETYGKPVEQKFSLPLDGRIYSGRRNDLHGYVSTESEHPKNAIYDDMTVSETVRRWTGFRTVSTELVLGVVRITHGEEDNRYDITLREDGAMREGWGPPVPDTPKTKRELQILNEYGPYGLVYHGILREFDLMTKITAMPPGS